MKKQGCMKTEGQHESLIDVYKIHETAEARVQPFVGHLMIAGHSEHHLNVGATARYPYVGTLVVDINNDRLLKW